MYCSVRTVVNKCELQMINTRPVVENVHISPTQIRAKLPKITLQKFRGNVTNLKPFWKSFKAAVHDNGSISKFDKINYLFSHLEDAAARSVQGLTLTEANYDTAIAILEERFGRPQQIIAAHMDELLKVPPCSNERSSSIRFVYDKIRLHVRGLEALGVSPEQYGSLLMPILMSKLPNILRLEVARKSTNEIWRIDELLETIRREIEAREASDQVKLHDSRSPPPPPHQGDVKNVATYIINQFVPEVISLNHQKKPKKPQSLLIKQGLVTHLKRQQLLYKCNWLITKGKTCPASNRSMCRCER